MKGASKIAVHVLNIAVFCSVCFKVDVGKVCLTGEFVFVSLTTPEVDVSTASVDWVTAVISQLKVAKRVLHATINYATARCFVSDTDK